MAAASDPGPPELPAEEEPRCLSLAAGVSVGRLENSAEAAGARWNAGYPDPAACAPRAATALAAAERAPALRALSAHTGTSRAAALAAAPLGDIDPRNTAAGKPVAGRAHEERDGPIGPIRFDAAPSHGPSARPNVAAHRTATRPRRLADGDSSARVSEGRTPARLPGPPAPRGRCTRNSRTSYLFRTPSTCHRRRSSSR